MSFFVIKNLVCINLDGITLSNMPDEYIFQSEQEDLDWESMCLPLHDLQIAMRRDTEKDVNRIRKQIKAKRRWGFWGSL